MDTELAKTFLQVMQNGTFAKAAEQLYVTQTTVTTRIQTLESLLGGTLFVRNRKGARLTPQGEQFVPYAKALLATWEQARECFNDTADSQKIALKVGSENSLWNPILADVLGSLIQVERFKIASVVSDSDKLYSDLRNHQLDAIIVHSARYYPDLYVEQVAEEKLIHVRSTKQMSPDIYIDWGEAFERQFESCLPFDKHNAMYCSLGPMALKVMLNQGGNGYFRTRVVSAHIASGALARVEQSPEFSYPIYFVSHQNNDSDAVAIIRETVKTVLAESGAWQIG